IWSAIEREDHSMVSKVIESLHEYPHVVRGSKLPGHVATEGNVDHSLGIIGRDETFIFERQLFALRRTRETDVN
ncbi:hypothetical protein PENTCL1PPCAC_25992, partial [Pristionchus entomophagus]